MSSSSEFGVMEGQAMARRSVPSETIAATKKPRRAEAFTHFTTSYPD